MSREVHHSVGGIIQDIHTVQIHDSQTGNWGKGIGGNREEALKRAADDLSIENACDNNGSDDSGK